MVSSIPICLAIAALTPLASAHIAFWHKSMFGFNVTAETFSYDNRPQTPLQDYTFKQWWFHGHLDYPPHDGDFFELPARGKVNTELSCDKGSTSWYASSSGGNAGYGTNSPCVGQPISQFHTTGFDDVKGCALAIAYKSNARDVQPEDFAVFSVNHTCVWYLNTAFEVPDLPECPPGGCTCAWFWIHSPDSGSEQNYMNGFKCKVTGATSSKQIGTPAVARRCGADPAANRMAATPSNCTVGPKQPLYWYQKERNNMFEGDYSPPYYLDLYNFKDGAQNDIFQEPSVGGTAVDGGSVKTPSSSPVTLPSSTKISIQPSSSPASDPKPAPSSSKAPTANSSPSSSPSNINPSKGNTSPSPVANAAKPASDDKDDDPAPTSPSSSAAGGINPAPTKKCKPRNRRRSENIKRHLKKRIQSFH